MRVFVPLALIAVCVLLAGWGLFSLLEAAPIASPLAR